MRLAAAGRLQLTVRLEYLMYSKIKRPKKGIIYQSVRGQRRIVTDIKDEVIFYRTIGKTCTDRETHVAIWAQWCDANSAFLMTNNIVPNA